MAAPTGNQPSTAITAYENALIFGDISGLDERGRLQYLQAMCEQTGLSVAARPFGYMKQWSPGGEKLVFYLTAAGAAQLRQQHRMSITKVVDEGEVDDGLGPCYRWTVYGRLPNGAEDVEIGSVPLYRFKGKGEQREIELLAGKEKEDKRKASLTQGKTRLTKSLTGLAGVLSEDEMDVERGGGPSVPMSRASTLKLPQQAGGVSDLPRTVTPMHHTLAERMARTWHDITGDTEQVASTGPVEYYEGIIAHIMELLAGAVQPEGDPGISSEQEELLKRAKGTWRRDYGVQLTWPANLRSGGADTLIGILTGVKDAASSKPEPVKAAV